MSAALSPDVLVVIAAGLFFAGCIKGATGLGYSTVALPFLVWALGLDAAITIVLMPAMATNLGVALGSGHLRETLSAFAPLYGAMVPAVAAGASLLVVVERRLAVAVLGMIIIAYASFALVRPAQTFPPRTARRLRIPVGVASGLLTGLTGSQVMPPVPYVVACGLEPRRTVQAINLGVLLASSVLLAWLYGQGRLDISHMALSAAAIVPALLGTALGRKLAGHLPAQRFRDLVLCVLLICGIGLVAR